MVWAFAPRSMLKADWALRLADQKVNLDRVCMLRGVRQLKLRCDSRDAADTGCNATYAIATSAMPPSPARFNVHANVTQMDLFFGAARTLCHFLNSRAKPVQSQVHCPARQAARRSAISDVMCLFAFGCDHCHFSGAFFWIYGNTKRNICM